METFTLSPKEVHRPGLLKVLCSGRLTNAQVAAALRITVRQVRRLKRRFEAGGPSALVHGNRGRPSPLRVPAAVREAVVQFMTTAYVGFNDTHLTEKLREHHALGVSRQTVDVASVSSIRVSGKAQRHQLGRDVRAANRDDDVLPPARHVRHERAAGVGRKLDLSQEHPRRLVEHLERGFVGRKRHDRNPRSVLSASRADRAALLGDAEESTRDEREAAAIPAEAGEVERRQNRVAPRAFAERRHPRVLASIEVNRDDAAKWWLEERQASRAEESLEASDVALGDGAAGRWSAQRQDVGLGYRGYVEPPGRRVGGGARPARSATDTWQGNGAALAGGSEQRAPVVPIENRQRLLAQLRREVDQLLLPHTLTVKRGRPGRERLSRGRLLAGNRGLGHHPVLDRPDWSTRQSIEHVDESLLGDLRHGLDAPAIDRDVNEVRGRGDVVIPHVVAEDLRVPDPTAGGGLQADQAVREEVVTVTV